METIKSYLEAMFANLPNTDSVRKAKFELLQMMEDKYSELISEGVSENEAVGTVISEFGNLDDLAEELGLEEEIKITTENISENPRRYVSYDEVKEFLLTKSKSALLVASGVMLCILCVCGPIISDATRTTEILGVIAMFLMICVAVGLFIYNGSILKKWDYLKKESCQIDMMTADYAKDVLEKYEPSHVFRLIIGISLCVVCWVPAAILDELKHLDDLGAILLFVIVSIGVFLIVYTNNLKSALEFVLNINDKKTISGHYGKTDEDIEYIDDNARTVMEIYWSVVTCVYLIWSFITFDWWMTWIIWPIAGMVHSILKTSLRKR